MTPRAVCALHPPWERRHPLLPLPLLLCLKEMNVASILASEVADPTIAIASASAVGTDVIGIIIVKAAGLEALDTVSAAARVLTTITTVTEDVA